MTIDDLNGRGNEHGRLHIQTDDCTTDGKQKEAVMRVQQGHINRNTNQSLSRSGFVSSVLARKKRKAMCDSSLWMRIVQR